MMEADVGTVMGPLAVDGSGADDLPDASSRSPTDRRRLRVLHLGRVGFVGGAERVMLNIACAGRSHGVEPHIACPPGFLLQEAQRGGVPVTPMAFSRMQITLNPLKYLAYVASLASNSRRLIALCRELEIDVLHVHHPVTALYCYHAVKRLGLPLVLHLHEGPPGRPLYKLALGRAAKLASRILCVSSSGMQLLRDSRAQMSKAIVVHNGVDVARTRSQQPAMTRDQANAIRVAVIGYIEPRKGQHVFVDSVATIAPDEPRLRCHIIGDTPANGAATYKGRLRERVARLGLQHQIDFIPYTADIIDQMTRYDIVVSSSIGLESLALVVLEAMSRGRVVVSTNIGGIDEVIEHGVNGFLAEPGCARSLAKSIREAIACDRDAVGAAAMRTIAARPSVDAMCATVSRIYRELESARERMVAP